ncbi:MAG: PD40 domain-containing protein [candidate division Zixibacteria bacterium]|nr:PD40 domain-containing protein [candidate division Zixibacteria bacterium]
MNKNTIIILFVFLAIAFTATAQETYFGKNKVHYQKFEWQYIQTRHFDIYFYNQRYSVAKYAADVLEDALEIVSEQLGYRIHERIPVFLYSARNDFQQTNIVQSLLGEGVGGFTETAKNRIVVYLEGSVEDFRHVLHHELTHAVTFDMLYGNLFTSILSRQRLFNMPLWFAEGYAEFSSRFGWHYHADMIVRDATINGYLAPPDYIYGGMEYYQGFAMVRYIADTYGVDKIGELLAKGKVHLTMNKAMKSAIGITLEEFWEDFSLEMKRRYWPEINERKQPDEVAKALTEHEKDASNYNAKPVFSPKGDRLAIFTDRSDYNEIYLISAIDGREIEKLVEAQRSGDVETVYSYYSSIGFSPDGEKIVFVSKSKGEDALCFLTLKDKDIYLRKFFGYHSILHPTWSPDGTMVAFSALDGPRRDIVIYDIEGDSTFHVMDDRYDDVEPSWFPDSKRLAFSSDRPHPDNALILADLDKKHNGIDYRTIYMPEDFGNYAIFAADITTGIITPVPCGSGQCHEPAVSPDGKKVCFVSNRNGIDNLYITYIDSSATFAITDLLTGAQSPSWSPDGMQVAFASFHKGGYDVFLMKDIQPAGNNGVLEPTGYVKGEYGQPLTPDGQLPEYVEYDDDGIDQSALARHATDTDSLGIMPDTASVSAPIDDTESSTASRSDSTRIEDDEFVFVSPNESTDPLDSLFENVADSTSGIGGSFRTAEQAAVFDSIADNNTLPNGEYIVHNYKAKFTPDVIAGGFSYDTFFGLQGQSAFLFSDYLGDHQIYLLTDLVNSFEQANLQMYYFYNRMRTNLGVGIFHTKNYYLDSDDYLFSDRFYGIQFYASHPYSKYFRAEASVSQTFIDRKYHDDDDPREGRSSKVTYGTFSLVQDNIIWGVTGPLDGRRSRLDLSGAYDLFNSDNSISFYAAEFDYRRYWHIKGLFSFAYRLSAGASWGNNPKRYFLGGTTNFIGNTVVDAEVYDVENLYYADVITPMRGFEYYELSGTRFFLSNFEFRYPFIDYLKMNFPLPLTIGYVTGAIFSDFGAAWDGNDFKGATAEGDNPRLLDIKSAFGFGIRANLGIFVLRYDLAWHTDYNTVAHKPKYYFSLGADF